NHPTVLWAQRRKLRDRLQPGQRRNAVRNSVHGGRPGDGSPRALVDLIVGVRRDRSAWLVASAPLPPAGRSLTFLCGVNPHRATPRQKKARDSTFLAFF